MSRNSLSRADLASAKRLYKLDTLSPSVWTETASEGAFELDSVLPSSSSASVDNFDPLGLKRGLPQVADEIHPSVSMGSKTFKPAVFLATFHADVSYRDLEDALQFLGRALEERSGQLKVLVQENFDRFVSVKQEVDDVRNQLKAFLSSDMSSEHGTKRIKETLRQASTKSDTVYVPILENAEKAARLRATLALFENSKFFFSLPNLLVSHVASGRPDLAVREFKKARYIHNGSPTGAGLLNIPASAGKMSGAQDLEKAKKRLFERVWSTVERIMAELRAILLAQLKEPNRSVDEQEKTIEILLELDSRENPAMTYLEAQHATISAKMRAIHQEFKTKVAASKAAIPEDFNSDEKRVASIEMSVRTIQSASPDPEGVVNLSDGKETWMHCLEFVRQLSGYLLQVVPNFSRIAKAQREGKYSRTNGEQFARNSSHNVSDIVKVYTTLISDFFTLSDMTVHMSPQTSDSSTPSFTPNGSTCFETGHWGRKIVGELSATEDDLSDMEVDSSSISLASQLLTNARWKFIQLLCDTWIKDAHSFHMLEKWVNDLDDPGCTTYLKHLQDYHNHNTSAAYRLAGVVEDQNLLGTTAKLNTSRAPTEFVQKVKETSLAALYAILDGMFAFCEAVDPQLSSKDILPKLPPKQESSVDQQTRVVYTLGNLSRLKALQLPGFLKDLEKVFRIKLDTDKATISGVVDKLDALLFAEFIRQQARPMVDTLQKGFLASGVDWANSAKPTDIRPCVFEGLLRIVEVHAMIGANSRSVLSRTMTAMVENLTVAVLQAVKRIPAFDMGGMLKATLEVEFLHQTIVQYLSPTSKENFTTIYENISKKQVRAVSGPDKDQLVADLDSVKSILLDARHRTSVIFMCFKAKRRKTTRGDSASQASGNSGQTSRSGLSSGIIKQMEYVAPRDIAFRTSGRDASRPTPHVGPGLTAYQAQWKSSVGPDSKDYWGKLARDTIYWNKEFSYVSQGGFEHGDIAWFPDGMLNASYNCLDRWVLKHPDKIAIIYEADQPGEDCTITYAELLREVCRVANILKSWGIKKGDTVSVYLPMIWQAVAAFLACARIGAIHSVIFAGFSADALRDRIQDCKSRCVITTDEARRGGKTVATKSIVDTALSQYPLVEKVLVFQRTGNPVPWTEGRDFWWHELTLLMQPTCPIQFMNSEDPLFILYTSGSTGKPKGVVHSTAGYLLGAALTVKYIFDLHPNDRFACMADIGWITGHTYIVYGPLMNGVSTTVFESTPVYPTAARYWQTVAKHKITQFYTAPTAIRLLRKMGHEHTQDMDLSSLRILGSVGEPIQPEAWEWYNEHVGKGQCAIVDTYWSTETGSIVITPLPGATPTKPGSATFPFFGINAVLVDPMSGKELKGNSEEGVLCIRDPWPSVARTIYGDHNRYLDVYMRPYPGLYFTGDAAARDKDGYIWIKGRVDDVINVSGHRMSTAEIEAALILHQDVAETAVDLVAIQDEMTGQAVFAFVNRKADCTLDDQALIKQLIAKVREAIGPFASPKLICLCNDLPKTRSGKIMRRILRKLVAGDEDLGDTSTLADPTVVDDIKIKVKATLSHRR